MHIGHTLVPDTEVYTGWVSREADNLIATVETLAISGANIVVSIQVYTKNSEDQGPGKAAGTATTISATGFTNITRGPEYSATAADQLKELVRFHISVTDSTSQGDGHFVYRFLEPTWFDTAKV